VQRIDNFWMGVTADCWPPTANVVDVLVAIYIPDVGSFYAVEDDGLSADGFEGSHWGTDASWHEFLGGGENFF
jgi:hypothetical protein